MRYGVFAATVLAAGMVLATGVQAANGPRIGVVSLQQVIANSHRGQSANEEFNKVLATYRSEVKDRAQKLSVLAKQLNQLKKDKKTKTKKYADLLKSYQKEREAYQAFVYQSNQQVSQKKDELLQPIESELQQVLADFAKDHHYDILINKNDNGALYATDAYDVTTQVTEAMDKDWAEMQSKPAASKKKGK